MRRSGIHRPFGRPCPPCVLPQVLTPPEIFYARPSASVERWVAAVGRAAAEVAAQAAGGLGQRGDAGEGAMWCLSDEGTLRIGPQQVAACA